jgi:SAM-dependent methyltransferase
MTIRHSPVVIFGKADSSGNCFFFTFTEKQLVMLFKKKKKNRKLDSKEVGLELGLLVFKYFLKTEYLHYGYFVDGLEPDITNLKKAQENYADLIFSTIPSGVKTVLDVGCGSGKTAQQLVSRGYTVDCVSPGQILTDYARKMLGNTVGFFQCKFQDIKTEKKYDLILFSESFQYIPMQVSIPHSLKMLNPGGYILVSDFFKNDPEKKSMLGGGCEYNEWLAIKSTFPVTTLVEKDITRETAPTIDLVHHFNCEVLEPVWKSVWELGVDRYPVLIKLGRRLFRKSIEKMEHKHFSNLRTGENFMKYKKYMFYLFRAV